MNKVLVSVSSAWIVALAAACSSSSSPGSQEGGNGNANVGGTTAAGGSQVGPQGGSTSSVGGGIGTGGTTAASQGGSTGGVTNGQGGNTTVAATGGQINNVGGTTSNNATGGSKSSTGGGVQGGNNATGGSKASTGGGVQGGNNATGGSKASTGGGVQGGNNATGGGASTGGAGAAGGGSTQPQLVTSSASGYWVTTGTVTTSTGTATVTVNDTSTAQTWDGFGGAFNERGWSYLTTQTMKDQAIQLLFGTDGCRFAWGRIPIGASDYAIARYTDDEVPSGSTDTTMASFSITQDLKYLIPYIKAAQAVKSDIRFWASPWTPPTWMKTSPFNPGTGKSNSPFDGGVMKSDDATLKAHAQYFVKWVQAFAAQGINVEIVAPQNEPNYEQNYPSCHWETTTFVKFVGTFLGPALATANLTTKIMDGTLSNTNGDAAIGSGVLSDATAKGYIKAIGVQWGMAASNQVTTLKNLAGGIPIWLSETQCGGTSSTTGSVPNAPNDQAYGVATWGYIKDAIKNGLTAYNAWNMVLDKAGLGNDDTRKWAQNALLVADSGTITKTPAYHVFRHMSQFVDVGAKVVATSGGDAVAFKNPNGSIVTVMYNSGAAATYVVSVAGKKVQFSMPSGGWATLVQ